MKILACIDDSRLAAWVAREAGRLARATGAELTLVHAVHVSPGRRVRGAGRALRPPEDMQVRIALVDGVVERLRGRGIDATGSVTLCEEPVHEHLLARARRIGAAYIVIGSHDRSRAYEALVGSVTQGVMRGATIPVVVVPPRRTIGGPV